MVVAVCKERPERPMAGLDALGGDEEGHEEGFLVFRQMKKLVELAGVDGKVQVARQVDGIAELRQAKVNQEGPRKRYGDSWNLENGLNDLVKSFGFSLRAAVHVKQAGMFDGQVHTFSWLCKKRTKHRSPVQRCKCLEQHAKASQCGVQHVVTSKDKVKDDRHASDGRAHVPAMHGRCKEVLHVQLRQRTKLPHPLGKLAQQVSYLRTGKNGL